MRAAMSVASLITDTNIVSSISCITIISINQIYTYATSTSVKNNNVLRNGLYKVFTQYCLNSN